MKKCHEQGGVRTEKETANNETNPTLSRGQKTALIKFHLNRTNTVRRKPPDIRE